MNIKIDTTNKVIAIEDSLINMVDLIAELHKLIPNWKEYKLQGVRTEIQWMPSYPTYPTWVQPIYNTLIPNGDGTLFQMS